jgi:hypothetical protein
MSPPTTARISTFNRFADWSGWRLARDGKKKSGFGHGSRDQRIAALSDSFCRCTMGGNTRSRMLLA